MKISILILTLMIIPGLIVQEDSINSKVYIWDSLEVEKSDKYEKRQILKGSTTDNEVLEIYALTIKPGILLKKNNYKETLIIIKEGELKISINENDKIISSGSVALIIPGEDYELQNIGSTEATYYMLLYKSKYPVDIERGIDAGGSFIVDWNDLEFHPHDKGGIREYFERSTSMFKRFEMHVTTLNEGIKSHEPHTHRAEEIVLMINGNSEMQIGDQLYKASEGDLIFLGANVPHALKNDGKGSCMYFAFQWE
jgi:(S)-ureidoglycine aminohydrolase